MPRTYCRMRVNVNEKYIIHTPPWVEWSHRAIQDGSSLRGEGKEDKARLRHLLSVLLILCCCLEGGGSCRCLQLHCARNPFFCHLPNQGMEPDVLKMAERSHLCFLNDLTWQLHTMIPRVDHRFPKRKEWPWTKSRQRRGPVTPHFATPPAAMDFLYMISCPNCL